MSYLYYENLSDVKSKGQAKAIMNGVFFNLKPYFGFIESVKRRAQKKVVSIEIEPFSLEDLLAEELADIIETTEQEKIECLEDLLDNPDITKKFDYHLKKAIKMVRQEKGKLYRIIDESEEENFDRIKDEFLGAEGVYKSRKITDPRQIKVITTYFPYDILVLDARWEPKQKDRIRIYLRPNLYQLDMILNSMRILQDRPMEYNRNLIRLLENIEHIYFDEHNEISIPDDQWLFLKDLKREGTKEQREFVKIGLTTPDFAILEGPPGSGKTTTICEIIYHAIKRGERVLLVASTHVAVDNVIEKLMDEKFEYFDKIKRTILPIRIGRTERVSELATQYHIESFWNEERKRLRKRLERLSNRTEAQEEMLALLRSPEQLIINQMKNAFIRAANLVCGTTIGILQHPEIRYIRKVGATLYPYDLLILDEASKTTFQEFLVPSLVAERFIIVGDIKQLSPFVDEEEIVSNIPSPSSFEGFWTTLLNNITNAQKVNRTGKYIVQLNEPLREYEIELLSELIPPETPWTTLMEDSTTDPIQLMGSSLVIGTKEALKHHERFLPLDTKWICQYTSSELTSISKTSLTKELDIWNRTLKAIYHRKTSINDKFNNDSRFEEALGWRLIRDYELRNLENNHYRKEIENLIPRNWNTETQKEFLFSLHSLKRLAFPSIIELLQEGFERTKFQQEKGFGSCLTDGIPKEYLNARHRILRYQHRMHPDISAFPRSEFYNEDALKDLPGIENQRNLPYDKYSNRTLWIDVRQPREGKQFQRKKRRRRLYRNSNEEEAIIIIEELKDLLISGHLTPRKDGKPWEIAILTFYRGQERLIREKLQHFFHSRRKRMFITKEDTIRVELCVVDRFQGHEADIVFLSFVRHSGVGFLDTPNRLNVALTRARYQLILVGDRHLFMKRQRRSETLRRLAEETPYKKYYGKRK